jgi:molybdate-binding protein
MASCDPAAGLLAGAVARAAGFRLLVLSRSSCRALDLLGQGLVDVAGVHLASSRTERGNARAVKAALGSGYLLLKVARWHEGLAIARGSKSPSVQSVLKSRLRWVGREPGSGARQCQDELLHGRAAPQRLARDHRGVAEAIRAGWADVGVCVQLASAEVGLNFIPLRRESYELCFAAASLQDPRVRALVEAVRSPAYRQCLGELPGYNISSAGEIQEVK